MNRSIFTKDATAQGVAKQRLIETLAAADKRVINDPFADRFVVGAGLIKLMGHKFSVWLSEKIAPGFHEHIIARTRLIDDLVEKAAINGLEQYVILGAGYDLRAHRLELPSSLKIFEVDQPEVQAKKCSKRPKEISNTADVSYVPCDFTDQSFAEQLIAAGFDQSKSTIFTLEGVTQYITKEALNSTIEDLANLSKNTNSTFFISYVNELLDQDPETCFGKGYPNAAKRAEMIKFLSAKAGEPWISLYNTQEIESMLTKNGFTIKQNLIFQDLNSVYFSPVGRTLSENKILNLEHFLIATC